MPHEQYTPQEKSDLTAKRAVYEYGQSDHSEKMEKQYEHGRVFSKPRTAQEEGRADNIRRNAAVENKFKDLLKKRGVEIPDIDLIVSVYRDFGDWIAIKTVDGSLYRINPIKHEGVVIIAQPEVNTTNAIGGDIGDAAEEYEKEEDQRTFVTKPSKSFKRDIHGSQLDRFITKYQPSLLVGLYEYAEYQVNCKENNQEEIKVGDLSW